MLPIQENAEYLEGVRILLIDDSEPFQRLSSEMLKKLNVASVTVASTLAEGMKLMHYNSKDFHVSPNFDLVLMDMNLPDGNGIEGCRFITVHAASYNIPVVVVSGDSSPKYIHQAFKAGASDYMQKPLVADLLKSRLGMIIKMQRIDIFNNAVSL